MSQFHAVFRNIWQNCMLAPPPGGSLRPPTGNRDSVPYKASDLRHFCCSQINIHMKGLSGSFMCRNLSSILKQEERNFHSV